MRTHLGLLAVPAKLSCPNFENKIAAIGPLLVYFVPNMRFHSKGTLPRPFIYIHIKLVIKTDNFIFPPVISQPPKKKVLKLGNLSASEKLQPFKYTFPILLNLWLLMIFFLPFFFVLMAQSFIHYEPYASPLL